MDNFRRDICIKLTKKEDGQILISSSLADRFHDIALEVTVDYDQMRISDITVDFRKSPSPDCCKAQERLKLLVGTTVGFGLTKKLFSALGGAQGCTNLRNMLLSALPLALNFKAGEGISDEREMLDRVRDKLTGTCIGYPALGPE